jgi:16S rRNA (cytosine1402-N4)-methyltransferase
LLGPGAVCAVITFHSLEDRIIKHIFAEKAKNSQFSLEWKKPVTPTEEELRNNPSSRSAKFRAIRANYREAQI